MVKTKRLNIYPLTDEEMELMIENEMDSEMKQAYKEMLDGCKQNPNNRIWHAVWNIVLNNGTHDSVGDLSFKGLNPDGMVDIGYGIHKEYEGQGYMTEAVIAMVRWANEQEGVTRIEAETDVNNKSSMRVLQKAGFVANGKIGEEGPRFVWNKFDN